MAEIINMPRLSDTMEEGTVAKWFKKVGDKISEGDILAEIETDKATMEFESFNEGELLHIGIQEGGTAPVDTLLAIIGKKGEDISSFISKSKNETETTEKNDGDKLTSEVKKTNEAKTIPEGVEIVTMPRLSDTMEEGTVAKWNKKVGDKVNEGDILAEIETDKATMEFESFYQGVLLYIGLDEGDSAAVDSLLAVIGNADSDIDQVLSVLNSSPLSAPKQNSTVIEKDPVTKKSDLKPEIKNEQANNIIKDSSINDRIIASPLAKKLAADKQIDLRSVKGTGDFGRIIKRDIDNYNQSQALDSKQSIPHGVESITEIANSQMRKTIAKRLSESKFSSPHYYLGVEFNMDNAISFRNQYNSIPDTKISFNDIIIKAVALSLKKHPQVNSKWEDHQITHHHHVHIGVAVAVDDGLVVPVVRFADERDLTQIGSSVKDYASRAQDKKLKPEEMDGSTFTISNLGMFGIQEFTSIINQPNGAILSVGAIVEKPVINSGNIVVGNTMKLTLACDHRVVDGATGAQFLKTLREYVENPLTMLI
jgi:pyruvate dehydrogenase E2 component (dihydrolipoamide acetyltransferase)